MKIVHFHELFSEPYAILQFHLILCKKYHEKRFVAKIEVSDFFSVTQDAPRGGKFCVASHAQKKRKKNARKCEEVPERLQKVFNIPTICRQMF